MPVTRQLGLGRGGAFGLAVSVLAGLGAGVLLLATAALFAGGGHGTYAPAMACFPYTMLLAMTTAGKITAPLLLLAAAQFPAYGGLLALGASRRRVWTFGRCIAAVHIIFVLACFQIQRSNFQAALVRLPNRVADISVAALAARCEADAWRCCGSGAARDTPKTGRHLEGVTSAGKKGDGLGGPCARGRLVGFGVRSDGGPEAY